MSKKYKVGKGSISYKPDNAIFPIYIKVDEEIPENVLSLLKSDGSLDKLIENGTIVDLDVDLTEIRKGYVDLKEPTAVEKVYSDINKQSKKDEKKTEATVEEDKETDKEGSGGTEEEVDSKTEEADGKTEEADGKTEEADGKTEEADGGKDASKGKKK